MKRALAIMVALCTIGAVGFSQIAIKGSWDAKYCFIGTPALTSTLALTYTVAGFDVTSTTGFTAAGLSTQAFKVVGLFGPFSITGNMTLDVASVAYSKSDLTTGFDFGGIAISFKAEHWAYPPNTLPTWCPGQTPSAALRYTFTGTVAPVTVKAVFIDCCTGTAFSNLNVVLKGLGLCCGITYNIEFDFLKTGFNYVSFTGINIPLCCGVSFDIGVKFTAAAKELIVTPKFAGIGDACFTVWAMPVVEGAYLWEGIRVDGFRIKCTLADCNYIEFVDVFNFDSETSGVPKAVRDLFNRTGTCKEFEYIGLGFCGAGCCGGKYEVTLRIFFGEKFSPTSVLGITKFTGAVKIPVMANFTLNLDFVMPAVTACATAQFCLGWTFTF